MIKIELYQYQDKQYTYIKKNYLLIKKAQLYFYQKNYEQSLKFFKEALQKNPRLPGRARLGLGYCFYMLKKYELSKRAFQRVLQLDSQVFESHLGLAILAYKRKDYQGYQDHLNKAFQINPNNPLVLYYIAEFYYLQQDSDSVQKIAIQAIQNLNMLPKIINEQEKTKVGKRAYRFDFFDLKSRLYFMIGNTLHKEQQYDQAFKRLEEIRSQCFENDKELILETYKHLAYLQSKCALGQTKLSQQYEYYKKALQYNPKDTESMLECANHLTDTDQRESLKYFENALEILKEKGEKILPELYNNIGVLRLSLNQFEGAKEAFGKALDLANIDIISNEDEKQNQKFFMYGQIQFGLYA
ncbi:hypothetical protein IMG5_025760 [Ichthyophthirius multifiliis]|uniref:Tetratricopeptide repeat protein n=1 Tax=Ichthyophthirius multifiliis TaxID=5932 RepID=G0QL57_ICHMU|nr:hypothetical protein IMG5_025760 [Ichthyophthirius multifiliis]EGR34050.1 hypothetical protein IMG5_025760 [Ichthyophthirius multifiliis]|eukprot:XP_004039354.1 hypothetical protein IMG5_025760 [Ichthyophthirius multifiliis]